jgi:D-alanyl-D-alanine carboxypeptidase
MVKINEQKNPLNENLKKKTEKNFSIYWIIALIILIIYVLWIWYYLFDANRKIKTIYKNIENNKMDTVYIAWEIERIKKDKIDRIYSLDLDTDNSITKFVNSSVSFNNKKYIPENLIWFEGTNLIDTKWNWTLRLEALRALVELNKTFYDVFNKNIKVASSYRSYDYQQWIKEWWCPDNLCAKAGYSEHQSGLVVDLWETTTNSQFMSNRILATYYYWLNDNAHKYGFHNTYVKWLNIDWYEIEPWHWRYMWVELATYLKDNNLTIAEFYNNK